MILGRVMSVAEDSPITDLGVDASAGATSLTINDPSVLNEDGGTLVIRDDVNSETKTYTGVNMDTGVVSGVAALTNAYVAGAAVVQASTYIKERYAEVLIDSSDDEFDSTSVVALVPNIFFDRLPLGTRDVNAGERILMDYQGDDLVVRDFPGETPVVDGSYITPSTLPPASPSDGLPPSISPTPTVRNGVEFIVAEWDPISNADPVTYEVHTSSTGATFTTGPTTLYGEIGGTVMFIQKLPDGSPLVPGTTYYVRLVAKDRDGAAAAGTAGSGTTIKLPSGSVSTDGAAPSSSPTPTVLGGVGILSVKWTPITNNDPVTYDVHLSTTTGFTPSGTTPGTGTCVGSTAAGSFVINSVVAGTSLVFGTTYYVKLVAKDADGSAAASAQASGTLVALPTGQVTTDGAAPASSPTPTVIGGPGYLNTTWQPVANNDPVRYEVHLSTTTGFTPSGTSPGTGTCYAITSGTTTVINATVAGAALAYGTPYYVKIIARDNDGAAAASAQGTASLVRVGSGNVGSDASAPASSPTPTVKGGPSFLTAEWAPVANADPVSYEVHLSTTTGFTPSGTSAGTGTCYAVTSGTSIVIKTTVAGAALAYATPYYVKIVAKDADGSAAASAQGSASLIQVNTADIAANAITSNEIAAGTIVAGDIASGTITATQIAGDTITASQIAAGAITSSELAAGAVVAGKIAAGTIVSGDIAADTITSGNIAANAITSSELAANSVVAGKIAAGVITSTEIAANTITAADIAAGTITTTEIATDTITAGNIAANAITATELAANSVVAGDITAGAVLSGTLESNLVLATTISTAASGQRVVLDGSGTYGSVGFYLLRTNAEGIDETVASITTSGGAAFGEVSIGTLTSDSVVTFARDIAEQFYIDSINGDDANDGSYPSVLLADNFNRTTASGWGTASDGRHIWTRSGGTATDFSTVAGTPGLAKYSQPASTQAYMYADSGSMFEEVKYDVQYSKIPTANMDAGFTFRIMSRTSGAYDINACGIYCRFQVPNGGGVPTLTIHTLIDGTYTVVIAATACPDAQTFAINTNWSVRAQCYQLPNGNTRVRMKGWKSSGAEPAAWTITTATGTDIADDRLTGRSGALGFRFSAAGLTNAPIVTTISNFDYHLLDPELLWADDTDISAVNTYYYAPSGGAPFATLERAIREIERYNQGQFFIIYEWGSDLPQWSHTLLDGFVGGGKIFVTAGAGAVVTGTVILVGCNHFIRFSGIEISDDGSASDEPTSATIIANVTRHLEVVMCILQCNSNSSNNILYTQGSSGVVGYCNLNGSLTCLRTLEASFVRATANQGSGSNSAYAATSSIIFKDGGWPGGGGATAGTGVVGTAGGTGDIISASSSPASSTGGKPGTTTTKKTKTWNAAAASTYGMTYNTWAAGDATQGQYGGSQNHKGAWRLPADVASTLSGKTIDVAYVTVTRASYGGGSGGVGVYMVSFNKNVLSGGEPGVISGPTNIGSLAWGQTKTFKLPSAIANDLKTSGRMLGVFISGGSPYASFKASLKLKVTYH